jgi:hypothetical protein
VTMCETCQRMRINNEIVICLHCGESFCVGCKRLHIQRLGLCHGGSSGANQEHIRPHARFDHCGGDAEADEADMEAFRADALAAKPRLSEVEAIRQRLLRRALSVICRRS